MLKKESRDCQIDVVRLLTELSCLILFPDLGDTSLGFNKYIKLSTMIFDSIVQEYVFFLNMMMDRAGTEAVAPREGASGHQMWHCRIQVEQHLHKGDTRVCPWMLRRQPRTPRCRIHWPLLPAPHRSVGSHRGNCAYLCLGIVNLTQQIGKVCKSDSCFLIQC